MTRLRQRWRSAGGYREVLDLAFPLIISSGSWSIQSFVDRMFLTWYSPEALAASMPAGWLHWTLVSLFTGTALYVNTFVAQYYGAGLHRRIGAVVWQGIYLAPLTALCMLPVFPLAGDIFALAGHPPPVQALETVYLRILLLSGPFWVIFNAGSGFFSGLGHTRVVMWVNLLGTGMNMLLDYLWVFGYGGFPRMGIAGAAWATTVSAVFMAGAFLGLMWRRGYRERFATTAWRFQGRLFRRLLRFGLPTGIQFTLEMVAFTIFLLLVGKLGVVELAASNIAFNVNSLAFLPMWGMTVAVSTLVGQRLGENCPRLAERSTWSAFHLGFGYFAFLALLYYLIPEVFIWPFAVGADPEQFQPIHDLTVVLLRFVAFYCLFDAGNMVFSGALKGAGDTRFVAVASTGLSWVLMLIPGLISLYWLGGNIYWLWSLATLYICVLCLVFWGRFRQGRWKTMRVIESAPTKSKVIDAGEVER
ncbi:MAG: MATE family efflux transporter [Calditrichaeota bacterium]|nr:MAG: MATE family efflux transporter [Calditrichota bacterium]